MSLISVKNLFGPLGNKFQMGGLIIAVALVLAIRMGSSLPSRGDDDRGYDRSGVAPAALRDFRRNEKNQRGLPSKTTDDVLDSLIEGKLDENEPQDEGQNEKGESFQDIRKSLGLE
jgi:hypothetical protein